MPEPCGRAFDEALLSGYLDDALVQGDEQRVRVHPDHPVYDKFQSREPDSMVGDICEIKCAIGIAHIHHDFDRNIGERIELDLSLFKFQMSLVYISFIALGTTTVVLSLSAFTT